MTKSQRFVLFVVDAYDWPLLAELHRLLKSLPSIYRMLLTKDAIWFKSLKIDVQPMVHHIHSCNLDIVLYIEHQYQHT